MENLNINELREEEINFKKSFKGYDIKEVDEYVEKLNNEKDGLRSEYGGKISELQTSLSMMVRERDTCQNEIKLLKEENCELLEQIKELKIRLEEKDSKREEVVEIQSLPLRPLTENEKLELEAENEFLQKNNKELGEKIEEQNVKITDLTQTLTLERATNKTQMLNLQSELYKKTISYKATTENIIDHLKYVMKDMESLKVI